MTFTPCRAHFSFLQNSIKIKKMFWDKLKKMCLRETEEVKGEIPYYRP